MLTFPREKRRKEAAGHAGGQRFLKAVFAITARYH